MNIRADISAINKQFGYIVYEDSDRLVQASTKQEAYKQLKKEYGRCIGKIYRDRNNEVIEIGYIFEKKEDKTTYQYWVTLYTSKYMKYNYL